MNRWMRLTGTACVAVAMLGMVAGTASAQEGRRGGRGGFGGGFGRGGMFPTTPFTVAMNEDAQKELGLTEEQITKVKAASEAYMTALRESAPQGGFPGQDATQEERQKWVAERAAAAAKVLAEQKPKLAEAVSADQMKRIEEIVLQAQGTNALSDEAVAKALDLSDEQKTKIADATKTFGEKQRELFTSGFGGNPEEGREKMQALGKERDEAMMGVLTQEQKDKLASMKGKEFDVSKLRGRGGFGGGRGPGGGREGGSSRPQRPAAEGDSSN